MFPAMPIDNLIAICSTELIQPAQMIDVFLNPLSNRVMLMARSVGCNLAAFTLIDNRAEDLGCFQYHLVQPFVIQRLRARIPVARDHKDIHDFVISLGITDDTWVAGIRTLLCGNCIIIIESR
jgi:hypothetical protein